MANPATRLSLRPVPALAKGAGVPVIKLHEEAANTSALSPATET